MALLAKFGARHSKITKYSGRMDTVMKKVNETVQSIIENGRRKKVGAQGAAPAERRNRQFDLYIIFLQHPGQTQLFT